MHKNDVETSNSNSNSPNNNFPQNKSKQHENSPGNVPKFALSTRNSSALPIMGKTALLAKRIGILKNSDDSEIITKLVMEKFKNILNHYCQRSCTRSKFRKKPADDNSRDGPEIEDASPSQHQDETATAENDPVANRIEDLNFVIKMNDEFMSIEKEILDSLKLSTDAVSEMASPETRDPEEHVEYDAHAFLQAALGDELHKYSDNETQRDSSEPSSPLNKYHEDYSIRTIDVSMLVSESDNSYYSSFSRKMLGYRDRRLTSSPINKLQNKAANKDPAATECKASKLIQEGAVQHQIIIQISKALNICFDSREFRASSEYIEAEKILLLAVQKREAILNELRKAEYEDVVDDSSCLGEVEISNLCFALSDWKQPADDSTEWFVAIVSYGTSILGTKVTIADEDGNIRFEKMFKFDNLASDFEIFIRIYSLSVKNDLKNYSHESRFHIETETTKCPGPHKLMTFYKRANKPQYKTRYSYERRDPSFVLVGTTIIRIADLTKNSPFKLYQNSNGSRPQGSVAMQLSSTIQLKANYSGFLTIGSETGGFATWNRRWCCLDGQELKYWSYPAEQEFADPIGSIDLSFCVTSYIARVDRELCARPRTLLLELGRLSTSDDDGDASIVYCESSYIITRYYLSADGTEELDLWDKKLNCVLFSLRNWNCMKCKLYFKK